MTMYTAEVPHPGEFIRDELLAREWSQRDLAYVLGVPEQAVNLIVSGKRNITADMARALGDAFDVAPEFFVNLQTAYDLARARVPDPSVARKGRLQSSYPVREMIKRGWFGDAGDAQEIETQMARFFEVDNADEIPHMPHVAKKSSYDDIPPTQLAWLFRARQIAREMVVSRYSESVLRDALVHLRSFMGEPEEARHVPQLLTECGVRFVVVECLPGSKIDGVCFWLGDSPVIGMSIRFDRIDNFWFVIWHELAHVLHRHGRTAAIIDAELEGDRAGVGLDLPEEERIANAAASEFCVPAAQLDSFIARKRPYFAERDLIGFANRLQIHPGIVAGQLRRRLNNWKLFTKHLVKLRSVVVSSALVDGWGEVASVTPVRSAS